MKRRRISVRFDERTDMLLTELSAITGSKLSVIIRSIVQRGIEQLLDKAGNWKLNHEKQEEE